MRGLSIPIGTDDEGRLKLVTDDDQQLAKIIMLGLCDCTSGNPYQQLGIPLDNIFDINDRGTRSRVQEYLERFFKRLERQGRARLISVEADDSRNEHGEAVLRVRYANIKTRSVREVAFGISRTGAARILEE
jgi:hypothetical protein